MAKDRRPPRGPDDNDPNDRRRFNPEHRNRSGGALLEDLKAERLLAFPLLDKIQIQYRNDPHRQAEAFFQKFEIPAATGRGRKVGERTKDTYLYTVHWVLNRLSELHMPLRALTQFGPKHVRHILRKMAADQLSDSFVQSVLGVMRRWCIWIGKVDAVPSRKELVAELGLDPDFGSRMYAATVPKTLRSKGIDIELVLARMEAHCPVSAVQLAMQMFFGLRKKESAFLEPFKCDEGNYLRVYKGTKGKHERRVKIRTEQQRAWLERAKEVAAKHPKKVLALVPMRSWPQADRHFRSMCEAIGLTAKGDFHTTPHGLRHEYLCRRYEEITGSLPPVEGGLPVDRELHNKASQQLVEDAGHHNQKKAQAYLGNYDQLVRDCDRAIKKLYDRFQGDLVQSELRELCLTSLLVIGDAARGLIKADAITLVAYETTDDGDARELVQENADALVELLQGVIGTRVELTVRTPEHLAAKHTLEIKVRPA